MKWCKRLLLCLGFTFEYILPILLFGGVVPYTRDTVEAGLTKAGYIALALIALILIRKAKEKIITLPKSLARGAVLSLFPLIVWVVVNVGLSWCLSAIESLCLYWDRILLFVVLGRVFYIMEEALTERESKEKSITEEPHA